MLLKLGCFSRHCILFGDGKNKVLAWLQKTGGTELVPCCCMCNQKHVTMTTCCSVCFKAFSSDQIQYLFLMCCEVALPGAAASWKVCLWYWETAHNSFYSIVLEADSSVQCAFLCSYIPRGRLWSCLYYKPPFCMEQGWVYNTFQFQKDHLRVNRCNCSMALSWLWYKQQCSGSSPGLSCWYWYPGCQTAFCDVLCWSIATVSIEYG